ncbi:MAG: response regulator transcription factor [Anaerolineae bacterium]|nr:response regulator transcription factor [Anaerolineae bacterium]
MAQPSDFIRLFVDLGSPLAGLLAALKSKNRSQQQYIQRLLAAFDQEKPLPVPTGLVVGPQPLIEALTNRELDVLELLAQRLSNKEIADSLYISPLTVKRHTTNIFGKLGVHNRRQAIVRAHALGLIHPQ